MPLAAISPLGDEVVRQAHQSPLTTTIYTHPSDQERWERVRQLFSADQSAPPDRLLIKDTSAGPGLLTEWSSIL